MKHSEFHSGWRGRAPFICRWLGCLVALAVMGVGNAGEIATNTPSVPVGLPASPTNPPPDIVSFTNTATTHIGPPSSWVKPQFFDSQSTFGATDSGADDQMLLLDRQINAAGDETFIHSVRRILTMAGVQKQSTLTTDFSPAYQSLTLHWARLWRGKEHVEQLDPEKLKVVQPEREVDQYILNGEKSTILVLDDVRVGDIIDYAYSVKGRNPVLMGHFSGEVPVQLEQSADRLYTRLLWPKDRHLYAQAHGCAVQPTLVAGKDGAEYRWDLHHVPGLALEDNLPGWFDPEPWVQLTEFKSWAEVDQWAVALFPAGAPLSPELAKQVAAWKQIAGPEEQVLAVLRFVQDQVRYFGIEIGVSGEKPNDPSTVFSRRFGDCKDKSQLFVAAVRALGMEAWPVLVNSTLGRGIAGWRPTAAAFDHCIAVVRMNGQACWVDPTMNYQRGPLAAHYLPDYGCGLVIAPKTAGLTPIPHQTGLPRTTTSEYFQVRSANEPADLKVVTVAEGRDAEALRELFSQSKRADLEKRYTHFYSDLYPGIRMTSPVLFEDDPRLNKVETTEFYSIDGVWEPAGKTGSYRCEFYPATLASMFRKPVDIDRRSPLGIDFPRYEFVHTEVTLPSPWPADEGKESVADAAFGFQKAFRSVGNKLLIEYQYQSLADSVAPERMGEYLERLNKCTQSLGYSVAWR